MVCYQRGELGFPDQPRPGAAVHRPRPGRAAARHRFQPGITERSAHGFVTDLTAAGYVLKQKDGRRNRYQIQAHMPLLEPARNLRSAKSSFSSPVREPSVTGQPGRVTVTSAASASQGRKLPEAADQQDAAVGQTRKASGVGRPVAGLPGLVTLMLVASAARSPRMPDVLQAVRLLLFRDGGLMIGHGWVGPVTGIWCATRRSVMGEQPHVGLLGPPSR
jgi:hypothetical protein